MRKKDEMRCTRIAAEQAKLLTTLLFWQQTTFEEQALPEPTPTTEIGEQPRPSKPSTPSRTMPSRPRMAPKPASLAYGRMCQYIVSYVRL